MMVSTLLVILMTIPGLALFYGGLVRSKNMLSILMQVFMIFAVIIVLWCIYGYSLAFTEGGKFIGSFDRAFVTHEGGHRVLGDRLHSVFCVDRESPYSTRPRVRHL